jgi:replicative DNA helicase
MAINVSIDKQKLLLSYLICDSHSFALCRPILKPEYFDTELQKPLKFILSYSEKYKSLPNIAIIGVETGLIIDPISEEDMQKPNRLKWVCDEVEKFCRQMAVINAVVEASEKIHSGELDNLVDPIKNAVLLSLQRDLGSNYFKNPAARLRKMLENSAIPTGYKHLDEALYGGVMRGGITIFAAPSGVGKSFMLANLCVNHIRNKMNCILVTLELPESWVEKRIDAMMTGIGSRAIFSKIDEVAGLVMKMERECGHFRVIYMPPGTNTNELRAYVKNVELQEGWIPDVVAIDYLDLLKPIEKVDMSNLSLVGKYTTEELRAFAMEENFICYTASQMVKGSIEEEDHNQDMLAGGKTKVNTADNVITLYQPLNMKEDGFIQLQLVKTRTSMGQGRKIMLRYDVETVRFSDTPDDLAHPGKRTKAKIKPETTPGSAPKAEGSSNLDRLKAIRARASGSS